MVFKALYLVICRLEGRNKRVVYHTHCMNAISGGASIHPMLREYFISFLSLRSVIE